MNNIWILSEERPKAEVVEDLVRFLCKRLSIKYKADIIRIVPKMKGGKFTFLYEITGIKSDEFSKVFLKIASGNSSFVDYLVYFQNDPPDQDSKPQIIVEETKTDDSESRNTGAYQRITKFVYANMFYPDVQKIMLYKIKVEQKKPTNTSVFGSKMLLTLGVEIVGKSKKYGELKPFNNIEELIKLKSKMKAPPKGNVPINIVKSSNTISVSGRLIKSGGLSHDPNIGALSAICASLRNLGWKEDIVIIKHGLSQKHITPRNKFIKIAKDLNIKLKGLNLPNETVKQDYWHYEENSEKIASIFLHLIIENYTKTKAIYENHAGGERGYLYDIEGKPIAVEKYQEGLRDKYKSGDKSVIISIPDIIFFDKERSEIVNVEGKVRSNIQKGVEELKGFKYIEEDLIEPMYKPKNINRCLCIYGGGENDLKVQEIGFLLSKEGEIFTNKDTPRIITEAVDNLLKKRLHKIKLLLYVLLIL